MSVDSRTIDFAKTASIDMMALNNKVVNMRQVVKRTKVQVINKLCKNIAALKKKKGTDEQKAQNLRKAERFIEEIDSIKHLKEDKVSKYALANTVTFKDVCKTSTSAGPRAMARLTDHGLMQKVVNDFRSQHSDWRDLAAYLLVKQTGRRFKTKKQKQRKKVSQSVENIHASETMTKAYIQERFGKDGLEKAEKRFERKRKRAPLDKSSSDPGDQQQDEQEIKTIKSDDLDEQESKRTKVDDDDGKSEVRLEGKDIAGSDGEGEASDEGGGEEESEAYSDDDDDDGDNSMKSDNEDDESDSLPPKEKSVDKKASSAQDHSDTLSKKESTKVMAQKQKDKKHIKSSSASMKVSNSALSESVPEAKSSESENSSGDESVEDETQDVSKESKQLVPSIKSECVVKEFNIDNIGNDASSGEESSPESANDEDSDSEDSAQELPSLSNRQRKKAAKAKKIPSFLTDSKPQKPVSDPFFAGSDGEGEDVDEGFNDFDEALTRNVGDDDDYDAGGSSRHGQSMFYNPHGQEGFRRGGGGDQGWRGQRGASRWQRDGRGRGRGVRGGSSFRGHQRGGGGWSRDGDSNRAQRGGRGWTRGGDSSRAQRGGGSGRGQRGVGSDSWASNSRGKPRSDYPEKTRSGPPTDTSASSGKLHPSWEASKKRKAEQSGIQAFKGSKITFGDDD